MISMKKQKEIAIEMWQYIKAHIEQHEPIYSITSIKHEWLKNNYPDIQWNNYCLLCDIYLHPYIVNDCYKGFVCPDCPLSKQYEGRASYGCSMEEDTPWSRIVSYDIDEKAAIEACDEIIEAIKSI